MIAVLKVIIFIAIVVFASTVGLLIYYGMGSTGDQDTVKTIRRATELLYEQDSIIQVKDNIIDRQQRQIQHLEGVNEFQRMQIMNISADKAK